MIVELEEEERKLIVEMLVNVPLQGNLKTLPKTMQTLASLVKKFELQEMEKEEEKPS